MPSMIWRIMQILKGKWYLLRPKAEADNSIQEVYNSSYYTKVEFTIVFLFIQNIALMSMWSSHLQTFCLMLIKGCLFLQILFT